MTKTKNIAIIAHVDHGKTTLVDKIMFHCQLFRDNENKGDLILDNNDLERERGITITSKNVSVIYKDTKINIIDTPGHADFGGEVERVLNMADGVLLLVDAFEGPMPQTRFVLQKALDLGLKPCVVINKVDKENCTPEEVHESVFDLMFELGAEEWQLDFPTVYGSAKENWMSDDWKDVTENIEPLLNMVIEHVPSPNIEEGSTQMLITSFQSKGIGKDEVPVPFNSIPPAFFRVKRSEFTSIFESPSTQYSAPFLSAPIPSPLIKPSTIFPAKLSFEGLDRLIITTF